MKRNEKRSVHDVQEDNYSDATNRLGPSSHEFAQSPETWSDQPSDLEIIDLDDERWDAFLADDDELDRDLEPGDFWPDGE